MMKHKIFIGLGTNLGDRKNNLEDAIMALPPKLNILARSPIYQTKPWGYTDQADFLNMVIEAETALTPIELLDYLKALEEELGRKASFRYGPRLIDLDILFYDDLIFEHERLSIPHPSLHERGFVLVPLADIAPNLIHPTLEKNIIELLQNIDSSDVALFGA